MHAENVRFRLSATVLARLDALADAMGCSRSEAMRTLIVQAVVLAPPAPAGQIGGAK